MNATHNGHNGAVPPPARIGYGVAEAARAIGVSTRTVRTLIADGRLRSTKVGARRIIPAAALREIVEGAAG